MMKYESLSYGDTTTIINPYGTVVVCTLWSKQQTVINKLKSAGVDVSPDTSHIAVVGNLFGKGFKYMLRNLLNNPQLSTIIIIGSDLSGSASHITDFFNDGPIADCVDDDDVFPELFKSPMTVINYGTATLINASFVQSFLYNYKPGFIVHERIVIPVPEVELDEYPSDINDHNIYKESISDAWRYLVHRVFKFGREVELPKGKRMELQGVKVVITNPQFESEEIINRCGYSVDEMREYQLDMLSSVCPHDQPYTYGNLIRAYFGIDSLEAVISNLKEDGDHRKNYITTWDNTKHILGSSKPCLSSMFFRKMEDGTVNAIFTFRTHNASDAWYKNVYGLMGVLHYVCSKSGCTPGSITIFSHSMSLDPAYIEDAQKIHDEVAHINYEQRDPRGHFTFKIDRETQKIHVYHWNDSDIINEYSATKPEKLQHMIHRDCVISDINHAMYIGRQLERCRVALVMGVNYIEQ